MFRRCSTIVLSSGDPLGLRFESKHMDECFQRFQRMNEMLHSLCGWSGPHFVIRLPKIEPVAFPESLMAYLRLPPISFIVYYTFHKRNNK